MSVQGCEGAILKDNKRWPFRCAEGPRLSVYTERRSNVGQGFCRGNLNPSRDDTVPGQQEEIRLTDARASRQALVSNTRVRREKSR
jgi:hypothetical protein